MATFISTAASAIRAGQAVTAASPPRRSAAASTACRWAIAASATRAGKGASAQSQSPPPRRSACMASPTTPNACATRAGPASSAEITPEECSTDVSMIDVGPAPEPVRLADANDVLAPLRARFALPPALIYLDGNSLGAPPRTTAARVRQTIEAEWGGDLIASWNKHDWIGAPQRVGAKIARLIGAKATEVVVAD